MNEKLVSIIMPCYNSEDSVIDTITSIEKQDYKNIELLCIDDGSTDRTFELIDNKKGKSNLEIRIIRQENKGVSCARNKGIVEAKGKYIFFLDSDDEIFPYSISLLVHGIEEKDVDITYGTWTADINGANHELDKCRHVNLQQINHAYMFRNLKLVFTCFLYQRDIIIDNNIRFDEDLKYGEDNLFIWHYLNHIKKGLEYRCPVYCYKQNENSAVHQVSWRLTDSIEATYKAISIFQKNQYSEINLFKSYMPQRTKFYVAKEFALYGKKSYFIELLEKYNVQKDMQNLYFKNGMLLTLSAILLGYVPMFFYKVVNLYGKIRK